MRMPWIRRNGQAELRANLRSGARAHGWTLTQLSREAGMKYSIFSSRMAADAWFSVAEVEALARVLGVPARDLVGGSIFKSDVDRYEDFDHQPPESSTDPREAAAASVATDAEQVDGLRDGGRTRALCCFCGELRTCAANRHRWDPPPRYASHGRVLERLRCSTCGETTPHAVLLLSDGRDEAEALDRAPSRYAEALRERDRLIDRLRGFNVETVFADGYKEDGCFFPCSYAFNSNTRQWTIQLDEHMPPRLQVTILVEYWSRIATDAHGVTWDARDGVRSSPSDHAWVPVLDDLMADIDRFLSVERDRMVLELRDALLGEG